MKKNILTVSIMLMMAPLFAQTFVPRLGITFSSSSFEPISYSEKNSESLKLGFTGGIGYEIWLSDLLSVQPEINFIQKGQKREDVSYPDGYEYKTNTEYKYNYLEVPVLVKAKFGGQTKFYVSAGPSVGIGLGGKYTQTSTFGGLPESDLKGDVKFKDKPENYDGTDVYVDNKLDVGIQMGVGAILFNKVIIDARYGLGLTDLYDDVDSKNNVLQFSVGVPISLF